MDAGRRTMSALKTSEGGKSSRPDECSTHCGAQCGALLYPFDRSSASTDDSAARSGAMQGRASFVSPSFALASRWCVLLSRPSMPSCMPVASWPSEMEEMLVLSARRSSS